MSQSTTLDALSIEDVLFGEERTEVRMDSPDTDSLCRCTCSCLDMDAKIPNSMDMMALVTVAK